MPCLPTLHKKDLKVKTTKPVFISYKILSTYPIINASHSTSLFRCSHHYFSTNGMAPQLPTQTTHISHNPLYLLLGRAQAQNVSFVVS